SPGMLGEVLRGLPATSARAGLWQSQGKVGGFVEAAGRLPVRALLTNETKAGLRAHDTVVVFNLVGQLHGSAGLSFRILRERNGRRVVGNSRELPAAITPECAANGGSAGLVDRDTALLAAVRTRALRPLRCFGEPARRDHVERNPAGTNDQQAARGD